MSFGEAGLATMGKGDFIGGILPVEFLLLIKIPGHYCSFQVGKQGKRLDQSQKLSVIGKLPTKINGLEWRV